MNYLYFVLFLLCGNSIFAHEPNQAFFIFSLGVNQITVEAELPWSMRNALIEFNPNLETSTKKHDFENTFVEYIRHNLILKDKNGGILEFEKFEEIKNNGHAHQNDYLLTFNGNNLSEVSNTIMFNIYANHVNYNTITWNGKKFKTSNTNDLFKVNEDGLSDSFHNWWLLFMPLLLIILIVIIKKTSANKVLR